MQTMEIARESGHLDAGVAWHEATIAGALTGGEDFVSRFTDLLRARIALLEGTLTSDPTQADFAALVEHIDELRAGARRLGADRVAEAMAQLADPRPRADASVICWRLLRELRGVLRALDGEAGTT